MRQQPISLGDGFWRDASGRLAFDVFRIEASEYPAACGEIADAFNLKPDESPAVGPDQMFCDFRRGEQVIALEWDNWMGFMVVAKTADSEPLVREIAAWLRATAWGDRLK